MTEEKIKELERKLLLVSKECVKLQSLVTCYEKREAARIQAPKKGNIIKTCGTCFHGETIPKKPDMVSCIEGPPTPVMRIEDGKVRITPFWCTFIKTHKPCHQWKGKIIPLHN